MINSINIRNYQSHKNTKLKFHPGVNVIIGPSDSGKSGILRAINWAVNNRPSGDSFRSNWGGSTHVCLNVDEDINIIRLKHDYENGYLLGTSSFNAIKTTVPVEITKVLNLNEINLQQQLDAPFLLSRTSGAIATHFNKVAKLDKIDKGRENIQKWINEFTKNINYQNKDIEKKEEELEQFVDLDKIEIEIEVLEEEQAQLISLHSNINKLSGCLTSLRKLKKEIEGLSEIIIIEEEVNHILSQYKDQNRLNTEIKDLQKRIKDINILSFQITGEQQILTIEPFVNNISLLFIERTQLSNDIHNLSKLVKVMHFQEITYQKMQKDIKELQIKFEKNFPDTCPLCGTIIKKG